MENLILKTHEAYRRQIWISAWTIVSGAETCTKIDAPTEWADRALKDFDERFKIESDDRIKLGRTEEKIIEDIDLRSKAFCDKYANSIYNLKSPDITVTEEDFNLMICDVIDMISIIKKYLK